jgi:hypothetical protein
VMGILVGMTGSICTHGEGVWSSMFLISLADTGFPVSSRGFASTSSRPTVLLKVSDVGVARNIDKGARKREGIGYERNVS